jgi:hypothetical protein
VTEWILKEWVRGIHREEQSTKVRFSKRLQCLWNSVFLCTKNEGL